MPALAAFLLFALFGVPVVAQYYKSELTPPAPPAPPAPAPLSPLDSVMLPFPVQQTVPQSYEELMGQQFSADLKSPSNIRTTAEFDPETGCYVIRTKLGDQDIATPFMLSEKQYNDWQLRESMLKYYRERNSETLVKKDGKKKFNILDMNFNIGPLEKIFGPGGVSLKT